MCRKNIIRTKIYEQWMAIIKMFSALILPPNKCRSKQIGGINLIWRKKHDLMCFKMNPNDSSFSIQFPKWLPFTFCNIHLHFVKCWCDTNFILRNTSTFPKVRPFVILLTVFRCAYAPASVKPKWITEFAILSLGWFWTITAFVLFLPL